MAVEVGQCKLCQGYYRLSAGRLSEHDSLKTGAPCRGRWPRQGKPEDYPVGFDSDPWVMSGGLPERNRSKF
jgi:hypothetical protein